MCKPSYITSPKPLLALLGLAALAGCTATTGPLTSSELGEPERRAQDYAASGDVTSAIVVYNGLYARSAGAERARYAIAAATLLIDSGALDPAREWLGRAEGDATPVQRGWIAELNGELALLDGDPAAAIDWLDGMGSEADQALSLRAMATRGRALFGLARIEEAVQTLVERDLWLNNDEDILANHELIWNGLTAQSQLQPVVASGDPVVDGWLALLPVAIAARNDPFSLAQGLDDWFVGHPNHPAVQLLLPALRARDRLAQAYPAQIALLLPLRSLPQRAAAVRDGFIASYLQNPAGAASQLRIYDTDQLGSQQAYVQAQLDGADFIVGPLVKSAVEQVATSAGSIPTLALNTVDTPIPLPQNFYQFGLAPEDEATEIVRHAVASGAKTAVALFPNSEWGLRIFDSFQREFVRLGGHVLESRAYDSATQDFSLAITTLLNLNDSTQRRQRLAANLGVPIEFEPRRRQDVDMIFFAAEPAVARLLAPQFRFHFAGNLPTYATSEIYDAANRSEPDLNGVIFADTPWLLSPNGSAAALKETLQGYWPQRATRWLRLYGLGFDAYRIVPTLYHGGQPFLSLQGMSGQLSLDTAGRIHRRLPVAQFENGRPVRLAPDDALDGSTEAPILSQR